ncbi:GTPase-activating protein gyp10 [Xylariales sp. AK1849]|nr:GTPase-activating protein gyp10 [Xylariales sp. AK1849]
MSREGASWEKQEDDLQASNTVAAEAQSGPRTQPNAGGESHAAESSRAKALVILDACNRRDIDDLKDLAVSRGGFISDAIRRQAWPILLGITPCTGSTKRGQESTSKLEPREPVHKDPASKDVDADAYSTSWRELPRHRDEDQVRLDVDRSFIYYPHHQSKAQLDFKKTELSDLITETLRRQPYLCYFQGYHDICQVFLLVLPPPLRAAAVARLSALRIRDFMLTNLQPAISQLRLIPDILLAVDPELCRHLSDTQPFFALSGTLTMYAHDIQSYNSIARLFDALLAREQVFSVYMFAQIVLNRREELFDTPASEPEMLHSILSKLPQPLDLEQLITDTVTLFESYPPESLSAWRGISNASVLKTTRNVEVCAQQSLQDGKRFFEKQSRELRWAEQRDKALKTMWLYRRPAKGVALAVLVGFAAIYFRRSSPLGFLAAFWSRLT